MSTESDLRELLVDLELGAPTVDVVLDSLRATRRPDVPYRRQRLLMAGAVAAVLATVVAISVLSGSGAPRNTGATGPQTTKLTRQQLLPTWQFDIAEVAGYTTVRDVILRADPMTWVQQGASITATSGPVRSLARRR